MGAVVVLGCAVAALATSAPLITVVVISICAAAGIPLPGTTYRYQGPCMEPTIHNNQIVQIIPYASGGPQRGDIIIFVAPRAALSLCPPSPSTGSDTMCAFLGTVERRFR
jgi:hypothetical protein